MPAGLNPSKRTVLDIAADLANGRTTSREMVEAALAQVADPTGEGARTFVKVYGDNLNELRRIAGEIVDVLDVTRGAADVAIDQEPPLPQVIVQIDREATARYGINVSDISDLIQTGIAGAAVSQVFIKDRQYNTSVRFPESDRTAS